MKKIRYEITFSKQEKQNLRKLAESFGMTISGYIKTKLFDQNSDLLGEDVKYICPSQSKQAYFLAFSQVRIQHLLRQILIRTCDITLENFSKFNKEGQKEGEEVLSSLGYKKIINEQKDE